MLNQCGHLLWLMQPASSHLSPHLLLKKRNLSPCHLFVWFRERTYNFLVCSFCCCKNGTRIGSEWSSSSCIISCDFQYSRSLWWLCFGSHHQDYFQPHLIFIHLLSQGKDLQCGICTQLRTKQPLSTHQLDFKMRVLELLESTHNRSTISSGQHFVLQC